MPDRVGISLMTPLAPRGYAIAAEYRRRGIPVVLGGVHASMVPEEASVSVSDRPGASSLSESRRWDADAR